MYISMIIYNVGMLYTGCGKLTSFSYGISYSKKEVSLPHPALGNTKYKLFQVFPLSGGLYERKDPLFLISNQISKTIYKIEVKSK
jgi:hypothetical protein